MSTDADDDLPHMQCGVLFRDADPLLLAKPTSTIPAAAVIMRTSALTCIRSKASAFAPQSLFT
jgi:hypothetical protein